MNQLGGDPIPNVAFYVVAKPGPVLNAQGGRDWQPIGAFVALHQAVEAARPHPGAAIMLNVCVFMNPAAAPAVPAPAVPAAV